MGRLELIASVCLALAGISARGDAGAAALQAGKPTDDSVCDLSPTNDRGTTNILRRRLFLPRGVQPSIEAEALSRRAARFITSSCADGQLLIVQGMNRDASDAIYVQEVAGSLCTIADIARREFSVREPLTSEDEKGFELRCRITKLSAFRQFAEQRENRQSMADFEAKLEEQILAQEAALSGDDPGVAGAKPEECGRINLSSILLGGNPRCR